MVNGNQTKIIQKLVLHFCQVIRKDAVALIDSFNLADLVLNSVLGNRDGDIYTDYLQKVSNLKGAFDGCSNTYWKKYVAPLVNRN